MHARRDPNHQSFRKREEGRSWGNGRFEASSPSEPELTPELAELIMKGIRLHRAGLGAWELSCSLCQSPGIAMHPDSPKQVQYSSGEENVRWKVWGGSLLFCFGFFFK